MNLAFFISPCLSTQVLACQNKNWDWQVLFYRVSQEKMISHRMGAHPVNEHFPETPSIPKIIRVHINLNFSMQHFDTNSYPKLRKETFRIKRKSNLNQGYIRRGPRSSIKTYSSSIHFQNTYPKTICRIFDFLYRALKFSLFLTSYNHLFST